MPSTQTSFCVFRMVRGALRLWPPTPSPCGLLLIVRFSKENLAVVVSPRSKSRVAETSSTAAGGSTSIFEFFARKKKEVSKFHFLFKKKDQPVILIRKKGHTSENPRVAGTKSDLGLNCISFLQNILFQKDITRYKYTKSLSSINRYRLVLGRFCVSRNGGPLTGFEIDFSLSGAAFSYNAPKWQRNEELCIRATPGGYKSTKEKVAFHCSGSIDTGELLVFHKLGSLLGISNALGHVVGPLAVDLLELFFDFDRSLLS